MAREARIAILGDSRDFARAVSSAIRDASRLEGAFGRVGGGVARLGKAVAIGAAGVTAGAAALGKGFVEAALESQKVTAQTDAVIKSMGNAANVTAGQVADLSTRLSLKSGIDDELIQSGSNVLLTFGAIRNEVGKGNNIFDRANQAALDMSVALGQDMKSSAIQVGKALNDPVRGLTALRRSGIQFTKQQEEQIKAMVEAGDVAGAQKVMLAELERQFGGSAEAQATAVDKLKVAWGNIQEQLGEKLLPVVETLASWLSRNLPSAIDRVSKVLRPVVKNVTMFWNALRTGFTEDEGTPVERFALKVRKALEGVRAFVERWWPRIREAFVQIAQAARDNWPRIQAIIADAVETIGTVVAGVVDVVTSLWENFGNNILEFVQRVWPRVQQVISGALEIIRGVVKTITALIRGDWSEVWEGIKGIVHGAWTAIQGIIGGALEGIRLALSGALEVVGSMIRGAWDGIISFVTGLPGRISSAATGMWDGIKEAFRSVINWIIRGWNSLEFKIPGFDPPGPGPKFGGFTLGVPDLPTLAQGGLVPGALNQPQMILAHGGERVLTHGQQLRGGPAMMGFPSHVTLVVDGQQFSARLYADGKARAGRRGVSV